MKRKILFLLLAILVIGIGVFIFLKHKDKENILVRIRGRNITLDEFERKVAEIPSYYQGFLATRNGKLELLNGMIAEAVLIQKAKEEGVDKREEVKERLKNAQDRVILEAMFQELQKAKVAVTDEEAKVYFENNRERFMNPEQVRVSHILVRSKSEARRILNELKEGGSFEELARKYSIDSITAPKGGDLGYISQGEMIPAFEQAVFALQNKGDISGIIETQFGYHLIKLTGKEKGVKKTPEEIDHEIRARIQNEKLDRLVEKFKKELMVSVDYELLDKVSIETQSEGQQEMTNEQKESKKP